jgi:hypothetical protein
MPRSLLAAVVFAMSSPLFAQATNTPKMFPPDTATLKKIEEKTAELRKLVTEKTSPDVAVYLKAAEWIVKHGEWFTEKSVQQTLSVLDAGLKRAKETEPTWLKVQGKPVIRGYKSVVDGSVQPFSVRYPDDFDPKKKYRADIILHGRDATLTEVKFLHAKESAKPGKPLDHFEVEVYGRGNNAYRWAGETDVFEAMGAANKDSTFDQIVLRGFSMGGAGTWHIGLRHPFTFAVLGPGAGFTTTRGYIANFPKQPDYIEKCLHIYDAVDYAENVFHVPVVAYSGEKDKQKAAADNIEAALKNFQEPHSFSHFVAPGLEHKQPPEWMEKLEAEYQKHLKDGRVNVPERVRLISYIPKSKFSDMSESSGSWAAVMAQQKQYEKSVIDAKFVDGVATISTTNVRILGVLTHQLKGIKSLTVDGVSFAATQLEGEELLELVDGKWKRFDRYKFVTTQFKRYLQHGPIDDAFTRGFNVVAPSGQPWHTDVAAFVDARRDEFARNWNKYFRGELPAANSFERPERSGQFQGFVLFGDPGSNPAIAKVLPKLPITWTKDELVVNGAKYDPKTHVPVLIYPNPHDPTNYVVLNSGHTFREADLKGTNALLYPRLGDWAVLKPKPTKDDPAGFEVVAAGLFDENWQFPKKK